MLESHLKRISTHLIVLNDPIICPIDVIVRYDHHHDLLGLEDRATLSVKWSVSVTEGIELLDGELPFVLIKHDHFVKERIEPIPIVVVGTHVDPTPISQPLLNCTSGLTRVPRSMEPVVALLLLRFERKLRRHPRWYSRLSLF